MTSISKLKVKKLMLMSQVLNEFENQQKPTIAHVQQILHGRSSGYGRSISSPIMQRMALNALSQAMGAKRKFGRLFTLGYDDDSAFDCMLIIARLVSLRQSLASIFHKTGLMGGKSAIKPLTAEMLPKVYRLVKEWQSQFANLTITLLPLCTCGHTSAVIGADMTLRPCTFSYDSVLGNLSQSSLADLWLRMGEKQRINTIWCENPQ